MQTGIYAIYDKVADMYIGGLLLHKHDAAAIRFFQDVAGLGDSLVGKHPEDFDLMLVGNLDEENKVSGHKPAVVVSGKALAALNAANQLPNGA